MGNKMKCAVLACSILLSISCAEYSMKDVYPYLVTEDYPIDIPSGKSQPIGNKLYVEYVRDKNGFVESLDISKESDPQPIKKAAIANLENAFKEQIKAASFTNGPEGKTFILVGNHWTAAAQMLNPKLFSWAQKVLGSERLILAVPHRDALLIFPDGKDKYFTEIKKFVIEKESDGMKMLTFELFILDKNGVSPLK